MVAFKLMVVLCVTALMGIGVIMAAVQRLLLAPLEHLREGIARVTDGKLEVPDSVPMPSREWRDLRDTFGKMVLQLRQAKSAHDDFQRVLADRTATVDRLLDFSQTIQGAGQTEQVLTTLTQFLETELKLSGIAVLSYQPETLPPIQVRASRPLNVLNDSHPVSEMNGAMCPCLRQNLTRQLQPDQSPLRRSMEPCQ